MPSQAGSTSARFCDRAIIPSLDLAKVDVREQTSGSAPQRHEILALHSRKSGALPAFLLKDVERYVEYDRASTTSHHRLPGLTDHQLYLLAACGLEYVFAHRPHGGGKIGLILSLQFLKGASAELRSRDVARYCEERHRVQICICEPDWQIG